MLRTVVYPACAVFLLTLAAILAAYELGFLINSVVSIWPAAAVVYWSIRRFGRAGFIVTTLAGMVHSLLWLDASPGTLIAPITSSICAWMGVLMERRINPGGDIFAGNRGNASFLAGIGLFSLTAALTGNLIAVLQFGTSWTAYGVGAWNWFLGDYTGSLMLCPLLLSLPTLWVQLKDWKVAALEISLTLLLLMVISLVLISGIMETYGTFSPMFLALPGAIILTTREASARMCLNFFLFTLGALIVTAALGRNSQDSSGLYTVQLYLTIVLLCSLMLHSLRIERGRLIAELAEERRQLTVRVEERTAALAQEVAEKKAIAIQMEALAKIDPLTGVFNRRYFAEVATRELKRARRGNEPLSLCMFDVDYFKEINDQHGHPAGDRVLVELSNILLAETRDGIDSVVRMGGEEFAILMPKTRLDLAFEISERIRRKVAVYSFPLVHAGTGNFESLAVTLSVGVVECPLHLDMIGPAVNAADKALYQAKQNGRNRVVCGEHPPV